MPQSSIARWEVDKVEPGLSTLRRVLQGCGYDLSLTLVPFERDPERDTRVRGEPAWIASLSGLRDWATDAAPGSVYRSFGLITPIVYLLLLHALWLSRAPGTRFLRWVLAVAAVADAFAYGLPSSVNGLPGTIEFFCLPLLLVGVGIAAWNQRGNGAWPWLVGLCVPLTFGGMAVVQYWPHGALLGVALACSVLTWATRAPAPATSGPPLPQPSTADAVHGPRRTPQPLA